MKEQTMSTIQYDMLYLLSCGVNKTKPQQNILEQYKSDDRKLMQLYWFSKQHFVDALTGTVLKQAGVTLPDPWEKDMAKVSAAQRHYFEEILPVRGDAADV